ncbi:glycosyltransferase family 4 protein [Pedobacter sp. GR22-10]|uniref:glycosyltransferase family 4 protein n=1 Tax=Pedobacter sp. GR22-10 TaxID=2994472 RepID=UPI002246C25E|nr:glycosyltransferase family 4 protein [Pedobacter sp. GR22-10]MCX2432368.1 glycosyltransferase family 4 protein [Pedobacter sp. GR22-10]
MKVILSQGQGKLLLHQTAAFLKKTNVDVTYISGWIPRKYPKTVNLIGRLVGKADLYKKLRLRQPEGLGDDDIIICVLPEVWYWILIILQKIGILSLDTALAKGWTYWGSYSKKYINDAQIFHVRSGGGQGGALKKANENGMITIADHSIAHPISMKKLLIEEYAKFDKPYDLDPETKFWSLVIKDCEDADYVVVNSDFVKSTFLENGYSPFKIEVIYLGVRADFIGIKTNWQLPVIDPVRLLFIGAFGFRKGARILIEAMKIFQDRGANIILDIIGETDEVNELIEGYKLNNIKFHGTLVYDDLVKFLSNRDIFVFPTFVEGSARAAMEAMGAGIPVITTATCGIPIENEKTGIVIKNNDTDSLVNGIEKLINNDSLRELIAKNAIELIGTKYTWDNYANNLTSFYKRILSENNKGLPDVDKIKI